MLHSTNLWDVAGEDKKMTLIEHAEHELDGKLNGEDGPDKWIAKNVIELIKVFSKQGHSGTSAPYCIQLFAHLASYKPLGPLTGEDDEWHMIDDNTWQNKRCSHVFKDRDHAYDIQGKVFRDPDGTTWTNIDSRVTITFPYDPVYIIVDRDENGNVIGVDNEI